jgi:4-hydroxy-tetrahydrodipicolinate reductase
MIRVGVLGAKGRMGATVCTAVDAAQDLELVARIDEGDRLEGLRDAGAEVAVDFTTPAAVKHNVGFCLQNGIHAVVGTTGLGAQDLDELGSFTDQANLFVAPNFAVGAVLMMRFASEAAPHFDTAEIVERHHTSKLDAPSGTAVRTAMLMNETRRQAWQVPAGSTDAVPRGLDVDGVRVHSLRVSGSVAHQEVVLGSPGETLTIRHDSLDRGSFMPGVLLAVRRVGDLPGMTVGLEHLLDR